MSSIKITLESERSLLQFVNKLEETIEVINSQDALLKKLSAKSSFWNRIQKARIKLGEIDSFLAVRK